MKINVTARHFDLTGSIEDFVVKKVEGIGTLMKSDVIVHAILSVDKYIHSSELVLRADHMTFRAKATSKDLYDSVNKVVAKMEREVGTHHKKIRDKEIRQVRKIKAKEAYR